jgi:lipoic acid synthetase
MEQPSSPPVALPQQQSVSRPRLPEWLRVNLPIVQAQRTYNLTAGKVQQGALHTVCQEAHCPNIHDCWTRGTATFMIAGKSCTRGCRFCSVETLRQPDPVDVDEPRRLAETVASMGLSHVVVTVVNRDDLPDGGASHYRQCIDAIRQKLPQTTIELLCSDLDGNWTALADLLANIPLAVFAHNVECVSRLDAKVRDSRASFSLSLEVLLRAKQLRPDLFTKSSLMVGLGETDDEVIEAMRQLRSVQADMLTLGQYLPPGRPGTRFIPIDRYVHPDQFRAWTERAYELGFHAVASGPLVRSSYRAGQLLSDAMGRSRKDRKG